jgi:hypothetical protein
MVFDNIISEVRRKYELIFNLNALNFNREEIPRRLENNRREEPKVIETMRKGVMSR